MIKAARNFISWISARGIIFLIPFIATSFVLQSHLSYDNIYDSVIEVADNYIPTFLDQAKLSDFYVNNEQAIDTLYNQCVALGFETPEGLPKLQLPCMFCEDLEKYINGSECAREAKTYVDNIDSTKEFLELYAKFCTSTDMTNVDIPCLSCDSLLLYPEPFSCVNQTLFTAYNEGENFKVLGETYKKLNLYLKYSVYALFILVLSAYIFSTDKIKTSINIGKSITIGGLIGVGFTYLLLKGTPLLISEMTSQYTGGQAIGSIEPLLEVLLYTPLNNLVYVQILLSIAGFAFYLTFKGFSRKKKT